jgi:hypothetical protein
MLDTLVPTEPETLTDPILAWRTWTLSGIPDGSEVRLLPLFGDRRPWPVRVPARASCSRRGRHRIPALDCSCGLYATHGLDALRRSRDPAVLGTVALWGRIVEHAAGYRAELAYPQRLRLVCFVCFWRQGPDHPRACEVVVHRRGGRLAPLCEPHLDLCRRYDYPVRRLLPASRVEQALLSAYAVDVLRTL